MQPETFAQHAQEFIARKSERIPIRLPVHLRSFFPRRPDYACDVSELGLGLETEAPIERYALVSLHFEVPTSSRPVDVLGRVVWVSPLRMGVQFLHDDERLQRYLALLRAQLITQ